MKLFRFLFVVLTLGCIALIVGYKINALPEQVKKPVELLANKLPKTQVVLDQALLASQAAQLTERGSQVLKQGTKVLGAAVTVDESQEKSSFTDKAINYGRYLYCKQVVEDWEAHSSSN